MLVLVAAELKMISLTLLRCSSWSCFLFKASSSSSSLERLLPSDPTGAASRHKKLHETQRSAPIKTEAHLSGGNHASCQLDDEMLHPQFSFWERQNDTDAEFGCRAVRNTHTHTHGKWVIGGQENTNVRQSWRDRQTEGLIGIFVYTDMMDVSTSSFMSRFFLLNVKYTEQHNARQTRRKSVWSQSQLSLSKSFVAPLCIS